MESKAIAKYIRMSPLKVNLILKEIRGKNIVQAFSILQNTNKSACLPVYKVLHSAVSNAENNFDLNKDYLVIKEAYVTCGPILKRFRPHAQGRAFRINKRTSHITIVVHEKTKIGSGE